MTGQDRTWTGWTPNRRVLLAVGFVLAATALAGCGLLGSGAGEPDVPSGEEAAEGYASIESISATLEQTTEGPNETSTVVQEILARPQQNDVRVETLEPDHRSGNLRVSNGSVIWDYNATSEDVVHQEYSGPPRLHVFDERLRYIFARLSGNESASAPGADLDVSPAPAVPSGDGSGVSVSLENASLSYEGIESVGDHRAHVVEIGANGSATRLRTQTLWLHTETFYPIRSRTVIEADAGRRVIEQRTREVSFDEPIPDERFRFEVPENATVRNVGSIDLTVYSTRAALDRNVSMTLPSPLLPPNFDLVQAHHVRQQRNGTGYSAVELLYTRGVATTYVVKQQPVRDLGNLTEGEDVEHVRIGDDRGVYVASGPDVFWSCGGSQYRVGGGLARNDLLEVARSMACE